MNLPLSIVMKGSCRSRVVLSGVWIHIIPYFPTPVFNLFRPRLAYGKVASLSPLPSPLVDQSLRIWIGQFAAAGSKVIMPRLVFSLLPFMHLGLSRLRLAFAG